MLQNRLKIIEEFEKNPGDIWCHNVFKGKNPGKKLLIIGGVHGNEPAGIIGSIDLIHLIKSEVNLIKNGEVHFLLGNPKAYLENVRYLDYDLNRLFADLGPSQGVEFERANEIKKLIGLHDYDCVLDLHSVSADDSQIIIYRKENPEAFQLAKDISPINIHLAYHPEHVRGLLVEYSALQKKTCLALECGNHTDENAPKVAFYHIVEFLNYFGVIEKDQFQNQKVDLKRKKSLIQFETRKTVVPGENFKFLRQDLITGSLIKKGEVYAKSDDKNYVEKEDLHIVMPAKKIKKTDIDVGFLCYKRVMS